MGALVGAGRVGSVAAGSRVVSIDVLKAAAILTVVYIHACGHAFQMDRVPLEGFLTWWAVPAFFVASGFLHFRSTPIPGALLGRWLVRLLVPYAIATAVALALRPVTPAAALFALVTGSAWGIYYFVPVLAGAFVTTPLLARAPRLALPCFALFWLAGLVAAAGLDPVFQHGGIFWHLRSPLTWWGYFYAGWILAQHRAALEGASAAGRRVLGTAALAIALGLFAVHRASAPWSAAAGAAMLYATNYGLIAAVLALSHDLGAGALVRSLSTTTYPLYLYHFFFTAAVREARGDACGLALVAGLGGPLVIVAVGRRLLGARARLVLG